MDWLFLLLLGLVLFFVRDVLLLSSLRERSLCWKASAAYGAIFVLWFVLLGSAAGFVSREQALKLIGDVRFWLPAILLHALLSLGFFQAKRNSQNRRWPFALSLVPAPVFIYCAGGLCWLTLASSRRLDGTTAGALLGAAWVSSVIAGAWGTRRFGKMDLQSAALLDFAAAANLSAMLLLPLQQHSEQSALAETALDGWRSAIALAATAGLIAASFLFHRLRRAP